MRLLLPVVVGFGLACLSNGSPLLEATLSGFLASLLLSWPAIYFPELRRYLVKQSLATQPVRLLTTYALFIFSYAVLARLGAVGGIWSRQKIVRAGTDSLLKKVRLADVIWTIIIGLLTNGIWEILIRRW